LSVTEIETWMRDPYAIYARHVLQLRALDPLDADPGAADRGNFIHKALDLFLKEFPAQLPADAAARLTEIGQQVFGDALDRPGVYAFWWPRFRRIADWFADFEAERRALLAAVASECRGQMVFAGPAGPFTLVAKADRVDRRREGSLSIIDYKTGGVPKGEDVRLGFSPQLPLEAAMAEAGGFDGVAAAGVAQLAFLQLSGGDPPGHLVPIDAADLASRAADAIEGLKKLIAQFDDPATPYRAVPRPEKAPAYGDYKHLARIREWSVAYEAEE
jgi:ATP-dependent helicase/nuclease subunit B